jgi:hypothetical protein
MPHRLALFLCLLLVGPLLRGQSPTPPSDRVVAWDGSVRKGHVRGSKQRDPSRPITFRESGETTYRAIFPEDVQLIRLGATDQELRSVAVELPDHSRGGLETSQFRFGEVLASGEFELLRVPLRVRDYINQAADTKPYLYVLRRGEDEVILQLTVIEVYEELHANPSRFRNKLRFMVRDCPAAVERARRADFTDAGILRVIQTYQDCHPAISQRIDRDRLRGGVRFDHYVQTGYLNMLEREFSTEQFSMQVGYHVEVVMLERFRRVSVAANADMVYHTFVYPDQGRISQSMIRGRFSLGYAPVLNERFRLRVAGGLSTYAAFNSNFNSFFNNNYALLYGGLSLTRRNFRAAVAYEYFPNPPAERPGDILLFSVGYRLPF